MSNYQTFPMKLVTFLAVFLLFLAGCGKENNEPNRPDPPPVDPPPITPAEITDTLASGWVIDTSITTTNNDIFFINNIGYLSAENIYKSIDGGISWNSVHTSEQIVENIAMQGELEAVFSLVRGGGFLVTHDGGSTFKKVIVNDMDISDVFYLDEKTVGAIGNYFWTSTDAGDSWTRISDNNGNGFGNTYKSIFFLNSQVGWISGRDGIFSTNDGGKSWVKLNTPDLYTDAGTGSGHIFFLDSLNGFLADNSTFANTSNAGLIWNRRLTLQQYYHDIHFVDEKTGYITDKNYIWKTIDGGLTWKKDVVLKSKTVIELHFTDANHGWACGPGVVLRYSK